MSKRIMMSVLATVAMSIGGFFVSCGSNESDGSSSAVIVQLPEGCMLVSPTDALGSLGTGTPVARVKPGRNQFVVNCDGRLIEFDRDIAENQHTLNITADDVH